MKTCPKCKTNHEKTGTFCSKKCANSRSWSEEDKKRKSESVKKTFAERGHPSKGKPGWKHNDAMKEIKRKKSLEFWDKKGRLPEEHFIIKNRIGVSKYRAKKLQATPPNADLKLIGEIYKHCPEGYEVDHIISLAEGGQHHQDNLQYLPAMENRRKNRTQNYNRDLALSWKKFIPVEQSR
jgi:uncharacterized Zn finger protein (UPF0148 family)